MALLFQLAEKQASNLGQSVIDGHRLEVRLRGLQSILVRRQKKVLKGSRWLLLQASDNLDTDRNERERLESALELNKPLATAYYLKKEAGGPTSTERG